MKKYYILLLLLMMALGSFAQAKQERHSVSFVASAKNIQSYICTITDKDKSLKDESRVTQHRVYLYEDCIEAYRRIMVNSIYYMEAGERQGYSYNKIQTIWLPTTNTVTEDYLNRKNIGREIMEFWLGMDPGGNYMCTDIIESRGEYAATDQDVLLAESSQLGYAAVQDIGYDLIANSYLEVITLDSLYQTISKRTVTKTDYETGRKYNVVERDTTFYAEACVQMYQLVYDSTTQDELFNAWGNRHKFEKIAFPLKQIGSRRVCEKGKHSFTEAVTKLYPGTYIDDMTFAQNVVRRYEIFSVNPISVKVGMKEGLTGVNTRYKAYKYVENGNGELSRKLVGFTRLARIANNQHKATGKGADVSTWVHIGGNSKIKPGMTMRKSSGGKFGLAPYYGFGGVSTCGISMDLACGWNNWSQDIYGTHYLIYDMGLDPSCYKKITFLDMSVGYGYGVNLSRFVEIRPFAKLGFDAVCGVPRMIRESYTHGPLEDLSVDKRMQFLVTGGADINIQVFYPVYFFARAEYSHILGKSNLYKDIRALDNDRGYIMFPNGAGLGLKSGIRVVF